MRNNRPLLSLSVVVMLVLTGQAMAFARAQAPATGQMVICGGHGSYVVYTDAEGRPTSPPQLCSDCLTLMAGLVPDVTVGVAHPMTAAHLVFAGHAQTVAGDIAPDYAARAPPVM